MNDDVEKNKTRIDEILADVRELKDQVDAIVLDLGDGENPAESGQTTTEISFNGETRKVLHWISPSEVDCSLIVDVQDAVIAFKNAAIARDSDEGKPEVQHGDFMIMLCEPVPDPNNPTPVPCYYIGMCVEDTGSDQQPPPSGTYLSGTGYYSEKTAGSFYDNRHFIAWSSCGGDVTVIGGGDSNYAFQEPDFGTEDFCLNNAGDAVGVKLDFETRSAGSPYIDQKAYVPLLTDDVICPYTGTRKVITGVTGEIVSGASSGDPDVYRITLQAKDLNFSGGLLISETEVSEETLTDIPLGGAYANEIEMTVCINGEPTCIKVPYKACN